MEEMHSISVTLQRGQHEQEHSPMFVKDSDA